MKNISDKLRKLQEHFPAAYGDWEKAYELSREELVDHFITKEANPMYGELDQAYFARLLLNANLGPQDVLVDVGSGLGL